jgi:hypothetical protein
MYKQGDYKIDKPVAISKLLDRGLPSKSVSQFALTSLFWAFSVGRHGSAGNLPS